MKTILVIEDQPQMRQNLVLMLQVNGFDALGAEDGKAGVDLARTKKPDLILCDVMMPELDGYGVLQTLRADPSTERIPFIFLTAKGDRKEQRNGMNSGADDYLTKPIGEADLISAIRTRLKRTSALAQPAAPAAALPDFSSAEPLRALGLTPREAEVLLWVAQGKSNPEIGSILGTSDTTAKKHVSNLLAKLKVESRNAAGLMAIETLLKHQQRA